MFDPRSLLLLTGLVFQRPWATVAPTAPITAPAAPVPATPVPALSYPYPISASYSPGATGTILGGPLGGFPTVVQPVSPPGPVATPVSGSSGSSGSSPAQATPVAAPAANGTVTAQEQTLLDLMNQARQQAGEAPLTIDPALQATAMAKDQDLVTYNYLAHYSPRLGWVFDQLSRAHISFNGAGENLAEAGSVQRVFAEWMGDAAHRQNILEAGFKKVGIAVLPVPGGVMVTAQFIGLW